MLKEYDIHTYNTIKTRRSTWREQISFAEVDHYPPYCPQSRSTKFLAAWQYALMNVGHW